VDARARTPCRSHRHAAAHFLRAEASELTTCLTRGLRERFEPRRRPSRAALVIVLALSEPEHFRARRRRPRTALNVYIVRRGAVCRNSCTCCFQNFGIPIVLWPRVSSLAGIR